MKNHLLRAFSVKAFSYLWLSEILTQVPVNVLNFFLILVVFEMTNSSLAVAGVVLSFTIPSILFGILAGVYVDHWNKKTVLFVANITRAILLVVLALFPENLVMIYVISLLISIATQFFIPAESPMIPLLVRGKLLLSANALFGLGIYGSILIAYIISGPMILIFGKVPTVLILAFMLFLSSALIALIKLPDSYLKKTRLRLKSVKLAVLSEIKQVFSILTRTREIHHSLLMLSLSQVLILVIAVLAPEYATKVIGIRIEEFPILFVAPAAAGVLFGAILLVNYFSHIKKGKIVTIGLFLSGISMLILPFGSKITTREIVHTLNSYLPSFLDIDVTHIVIVIAFLLGFANAFVFVPSNTLLQEKTSDEMRGKVYGVLNTIIGILSLLPIIIVGGLSDLIGVTSVIIGIGIGILLLAIANVVL